MIKYFPGFIPIAIGTGAAKIGQIVVRVELGVGSFFVYVPGSKDLTWLWLRHLPKMNVGIPAEASEYIHIAIQR